MFCKYLCNESSDLYEILDWILYVSNKYPPSMTLDEQNCGSMQNILKIGDSKKSLLFCKYLRNESSEFYEILDLYL